MLSFSRWAYRLRRRHQGQLMRVMRHLLVLRRSSSTRGLCDMTLFRLWVRPAPLSRPSNQVQRMIIGLEALRT